MMRNDLKWHLINQRWLLPCIYISEQKIDTFSEFRVKENIYKLRINIRRQSRVNISDFSYTNTFKLRGWRTRLRPTREFGYPVCQKNSTGEYLTDLSPNNLNVTWAIFLNENRVTCSEMYDSICTTVRQKKMCVYGKTQLIWHWLALIVYYLYIGPFSQRRDFREYCVD